MTEQFREKCKQEAYQDRLGTIENDDLAITEDTFLQSVETNKSIINNNNIIGSVISDSIKINTLDNFELYDKDVIAKIGVKYDDLSTEYVDIGKYTIMSPNDDKTANTGEYTGYNDLNKLDIPYICNIEDFSEATVQDFYLDVCNQAGLIPVSEIFDNCGIPVTNNPFTAGETCRDVLKSICKVSCTFAIINSNNEIELKWLDSEISETFTKNDYSSLEKNQKYGPVNSLVIKLSNVDGENITIDDEEDIATNGEHQLVITEDYFLHTPELREMAIPTIWNKVKGLTYYNCKLTTYTGNPGWSCGNKISIQDDDETFFETYILKHNFTYDGSFTSIIESPCLTNEEESILNNYEDKSLKSQLRETRLVVNKQEQYIESLISDIHDENGIINESFTKIYQDIDNIVNSVQSSGGNNLIKNSVMFAYDNDNIPINWEVKDCNTNLYNVFDTAIVSGVYSVSEDGWITINYDNTNGTVEQYFNYYTNNLNLESNKQYNIICETEVYENTYSDQDNYLAVANHHQSSNTGQFATTMRYEINNLNSINQQICTTIENPEESMYGLRTFVTVRAGAKINIKFRISVLEDLSITANNFEYHPYSEHGNLIINSSTESINAGSLSGHTFTLLEKMASQKVLVKEDSDDIPLEQKTYYTFSTKIKKNTSGSCYVKLYNANEEYVINLNDGESSYYGDYEIPELLPKDNYYIIEFYGSLESGATFTDNMFSIGQYKTPWTQADGEIMNTQVNINVDGILVKSSIYQGDYTIMSPLEFAGYSNINGTVTKVFSLNKDTTVVKKLEAEDEVKMSPIKIVPITEGELQGWAFVPID